MTVETLRSLYNVDMSPPAIMYRMDLDSLIEGDEYSRIIGGPVLIYMGRVCGAQGHIFKTVKSGEYLILTGSFFPANLGVCIGEIKGSRDLVFKSMYSSVYCVVSRRSSELFEMTV